MELNDIQTHNYTTHILDIRVSVEPIGIYVLYYKMRPSTINVYKSVIFYKICNYKVRIYKI